MYPRNIDFSTIWVYKVIAFLLACILIFSSIMKENFTFYSQFPLILQLPVSHKILKMTSFHSNMTLEELIFVKRMKIIVTVVPSCLQLLVWKWKTVINASLYISHFVMTQLSTFPGVSQEFLFEPCVFISSRRVERYFWAQNYPSVCSRGHLSEKCNGNAIMFNRKL